MKPKEPGKPKLTKAGISMKIKDMPICDRPIKVLGEGGHRRVRTEGCWRNKPKRSKISWSKQIQEFRAKQTQASYLPSNLSVTAEIGQLFRKFECGRSLSRIPSLHPSMVHPRLLWRMDLDVIGKSGNSQSLARVVNEDCLGGWRRVFSENDRSVDRRGHLHRDRTNGLPGNPFP